jgi:geranylgeranyl reductase family protein
MISLGTTLYSTSSSRSSPTNNYFNGVLRGELSQAKGDVLRMDSDVVIVGGGPAGSSAAHSLSSQGISVTVLEKQRMPRYKTCGGGVNVRAARLLPFSIEPVVERTISRYRFTFRGEKPFVREYPEPLTYMTQRQFLDKYLLDQARTAGANVIEGITVRKVSIDSNSVVVTTDDGRHFEASVVIGADGADGVVARDTGLMRNVRKELALESEIELSSEEMGSWENTVEIDLFSLWCGYGWVFPKAKHISIGVGGLRQDVKKMQEYNKQYLRRHNVAERKALRFSGHTLPVRRGMSSVVKDRVVLVGDAAGLLEPFTGEGIGYAIKSGQLAAQATSKFVRGMITSLESYDHLLDTEVTSELLAAERYVRIFNRFPRFFYWLLRHSDYGWNAACMILRGERSYKDIDRRLGIFEHVLRLV